MIVSRGELIEIGDGFRIPEIMARSGRRPARSRHHQPHPPSPITRRPSTTAPGFCCACIPATSALRDSPRARTGELTALGRERGIPVYEDLGSGCIVDLRPHSGSTNPSCATVSTAGADLVSFSGDKLLGGPQAGILAGRPELVARLRRNPLFRALRLDKLIYQSLETALRNLLLERWDGVPALKMIRATADEVRARAEALLARTPAIHGEVIDGRSLIGGAPRLNNRSLQR